MLDKLESIEEKYEELSRRLSDHELLAEAMERVRFRVEPHTWEAFELLVLENWSGAAVAAKLKMKLPTVFVVAGRVKRKIQEVIRELERNS